MNTTDNSMMNRVVDKLDYGRIQQLCTLFSVPTDQMLELGKFSIVENGEILQNGEPISSAQCILYKYLSHYPLTSISHYTNTKKYKQWVIRVPSKQIKQFIKIEFIEMCKAYSKDNKEKKRLYQELMTILSIEVCKLIRASKRVINQWDRLPNLQWADASQLSCYCTYGESLYAISQAHKIMPTTAMNDPNSTTTILRKGNVPLGEIIPYDPEEEVRNAISCKYLYHITPSYDVLTHIDLINYAFHIQYKPLGHVRASECLSVCDCFIARVTDIGGKKVGRLPPRNYEQVPIVDQLNNIYDGTEIPRIRDITTERELDLDYQVFRRYEQGDNDIYFDGGSLNVIGISQNVIFDDKTGKFIYEVNYNAAAKPRDDPYGDDAYDRLLRDGDSGCPLYIQNPDRNETPYPKVLHSFFMGFIDQDPDQVDDESIDSWDNEFNEYDNQLPELPMQNVYYNERELEDFQYNISQMSKVNSPVNDHFQNESEVSSLTMSTAFQHQGRIYCLVPATMQARQIRRILEQKIIPNPDGSTFKILSEDNL